MLSKKDFEGSGIFASPCSPIYRLNRNLAHLLEVNHIEEQDNVLTSPAGGWCDKPIETKESRRRGDFLRPSVEQLAIAVVLDS